MKIFVLAGSLALVMLGVLHGVHVARAHEGQPLMWAVSVFLVVQGIMTLMILRR